MKSGKLLVFCAIILAASAVMLGQPSPDLEQGLKPYGSYHGGAIDTVSLSNGNLFLHAALLSYSQRGGELAYPIVLQYNNKNFSFFQIQPGCPKCTTQLYAVFAADPGDPSSSLGAGVSVGFEGPLAGVLSDVNAGLSLNGAPLSVNVYSVQSPDGAQHQLVNTGNGMAATDGSGFYSDPSGSLRDRNGTKYLASGTMEDANGNQITSSASGWTDTLGRTLPLMPGPAHPADNPVPSTASLSACPLLGYSNQPVTYAYTWSLPTANGGTLSLVLCYASVFVRTNFFGSLGNGPRYFDLHQGFTMLQSVVFPDNTYWGFQYDAADPNNSLSMAYGDLLKISFPTGGSISYTWGGWAAGNSRSVATRTVDAMDGTGPHTWNYSFSNLATVNGNQTQTNIVTDPTGSDSVHTVTGLGGTTSFYETETQYYQGSHSTGTLLKTIQTDHQFALNPYDATAISTGRVAMAKSVSNVFPVRVTTTLANGLVSKTETDYDTALAYHGPLDGIQYNDQTCTNSGDGSTPICTWTPTQTMPVTNYTGSYGKVIATREYDWGQGAPGPLLRQTATSYQWQANSTYLSNSFLDLVSSSTTKDGAGNQVAQSTYGYDEYALNGSGVSTHFNPAPVNESVRGNLTSAHHWLNGSAVSTANCPIAISNGFAAAYTTYNDTGTVNQSTDPCGSRVGDPQHTTTHSYDLAYAGAYPTQTCNVLNQCVSGAYDFSTGLLTSFTDANHQTSNFSYDQQWRMTQAQGPTDPVSGMRPETDFDHSVVDQVMRTRKQDASHNLVDYAYFDGVGRSKQTRLVDPEGDDFVDTAYDALGRVSTVSNPHRSSSSPTDGITTTYYDALGRVTQVTHPDGATATTSYTGRAAEVSDEGNGTRSVQRISQSDGLGRLARVCEVSSTNLSFGNGASPATCGLDIAATGFLTSYSYDTLGNLTGVSQGGSMPRSFTYDSLSRLLTATNPESGTISYTYDAAGNVITKTDARNITTTYGYDVLHRLLTKSYSDGTPTATFVYDACPAGGCPAGVTPQLTAGRMVESSVPNARTFYSYDSMGREANQWQCTPVNCGASYYALAYGYDLGGDLTSSTNGFGTTLTSAYDTARRLTGVTSNVSDASHPANLLSNIQYNAPGLPRSETLGNNVTEALGYDTRLRLTSLTATSPTATSATPGTGTVTVSGSEGSRPVAATTATGAVTIAGSEHSYQQCTRFGCVNVYDAGKVFITVNGHEYDYNFSGSDTSQDTASSVAQGLVAAIQADGARAVNASCSDGVCTTPVITLTAVSSGSAGNLAFSTGSTYSSGIARFASQGPSFTASPGSSLSGGLNAFTVYDTGTVAISVYGVATSVAYGNGSTGAAVASALAGGLNSGTLVNATANGNVITLTSRLPGAASNYSLSASSNSSAGFSPASFTASPSGGSLTGGSGASPGTAYSFSVAYAPNSNVLSANDSANGNWTYGYDDFNRLVASNKNAGQQTYSYVYDRFGNRWQQNAPQGGNVSLATFSGGNNRLDGASHDAAGNMTHDPATGASYSYDAENRIAQVNSGAVTYTYDADSQRVEKNVGGVKTDYVYDAAGNAIAEINGSGTVTRQELFAGGKHLGTYTNNTTYFSHSDALGTERVRSDMTGAACETIQSLPYGDGQSTSGNCGDPSTRHFTGKERDSETGLDYFGARYYSNGLGRWVTPDWAAKPAAVPYAEFADPQSLNLYTYVRNIPTVRYDEDGHCDVCWAIIQAVSIYLGRVGIQDGHVRSQYREQKTAIERSKGSITSAERTALKQELRQGNTALGKALAEAHDAKTAAALAAKSETQLALSAGKLNPAFNAAGKAGQFAGPVLTAVGVGIAVHNVVTAPEGQKVETAAKEGGGLGGALAGGELGAGAGALTSEFTGPFGPLLGGLGGAIVGGIAGRQTVESMLDPSVDNSKQMHEMHTVTPF
jgi:RHS repeat-associated protein